DVKNYVNSCYDCNRNKSSNHRNYGLLQPLPIPPLPWNSLSMDFISQIPLLNGYNALLVVVDHFLKIDCDSLFVSSFWTSLCQHLKIQQNLYTAYHPESNGQTERVNQILKQYLQIFIFYQQDDWSNSSQHYKQQANKLCLQPPSFNIGDSVWLNTCNIRTTRPTPKLSERKLGPFKIKSVVSKNAFKLSLLLKWKAIHP
ncbi:hypothetical protein VP01_9101g1, partial [Puccinia sorghi]